MFLPPIQHLRQAGDQLIGPHQFYRVVSSGQGDRLTNGCEHSRNCRSCDLASSTGVARPDEGGKLCEHEDTFNVAGAL